ncbi:DUF2922 domain-containing protein [Thermanaeromonas sp. C210]|nr:DUF2922 domain-containing protein [Thermanaeromonas sp. C210]GFN21950.1 hypothetical protein TAMC210_02660 [Thermanaeromonas sp. C210]
MSAADVMASMELVIARNIFTSSGGDLVAVAGARIVTREITELIES